MGNSGSGKSSTTGTIVPMAALRDGWGIIAYATKSDDHTFWDRVCASSGRADRLRVVRPGGVHHFNLIRYELERPTLGGGNSLALATRLFELFQEGKPQAHASESSEFFQNQGVILLCNTIDALRLTGEPVSFRAIARFMEATAKTSQELEVPRWREGFCFQVLAKADAATEGKSNRELYDTVSGYFLESFVNMSDRTRGDVLATIDATLFQLGRDPVRQLLDSPKGCSFVPEMLESGAVIVIDCPVGIYGPVGRMITIAFKRLVKDFMRRRVIRGDASRPILNFADEAQAYVTREDADFQQVCRSNKIATMMLTQSIDNLEAVLGNDAHTNSLANALGLHVYHATSGKTAEWIERRIAQFWKPMESVSYQGMGGGRDQGHRGPNVNLSEHLYPRVLAAELTQLRTGGRPHGNLVDCIAFKPGRRFVASGAPFVRTTFQQE
jgi:hypothetical protein